MKVFANSQQIKTVFNITLTQTNGPTFKQATKYVKCKKKLLGLVTRGNAVARDVVGTHCHLTKVNVGGFDILVKIP